MCMSRAENKLNLAAKKQPGKTNMKYLNSQLDQVCISDNNKKTLQFCAVCLRLHI